MAALVFSILVGLAALVGFALAVLWVRRFPVAGLVLVSLLIIPLWEVPHLPPIVSVSGLNIYPADVIAPILFAVGVLEWPQLRANLRGWLVPWAFFGILIAVALVRGLMAFETASTVNEARPLLYFFWAMTWVLGVRPDRLGLHTVSLGLGWVLVLVALYHGAIYGFGGSSSAVLTADGDAHTGRILVAPQAMALLLCAATVVLGESGSAKIRPKLCALSALVFGGVVVIAQHRSVWSAGALGLAAVLLWSNRRRVRKKVFALAVLGASIVFIAWSSGILGGSQISASATDMNTYEWRTSSWQILLSQAISRGFGIVVFGEPFGSNVTLRQMPITGGWTSVQAHNWYVAIFLYLGVLGLIPFVTMWMSSLVKSRSMPSASTFVLAAVAAYSWAYSFEWFLLPWLGAAMSVSLGPVRIAEDPEYKVPSAGEPCASRVSART